MKMPAKPSPRHTESAHQLAVEALREVQVRAAPILFPEAEVGGASGSRVPGRVAVTGGGLAAVIHPERGLTAIWRAGALAPEVSGGPTDATTHREPVFAPLGAPQGEPGGRIEAFPGGWRRWLKDGGEERGVLLDEFPIVVVQRRGSGSPNAPDLVLASPHEGDDTWITTLWVPSDVSQETCALVARSLPARATRRFRRGGAPPFTPPYDPESSLLIFGGLDGGGGVIGVAEASRILGNAPLAEPRAGPWATPPAQGALAPLEPQAFVAGMDPKGLTFVSARAVPELALGALASGQWSLAESILEGVLAQPEAGPAAGLTLVTRWVEWTGQVDRLRPYLSVLDRWVEALSTGETDAIVPSFASPDRILEDLASALEPLGDKARTEALRSQARAWANPALHATRGGVRGRKLPVLNRAASPAGSAETDAPPPPRRGPASLPRLRAFADPGSPTVAPRRTLHAARMLRSLVEGTLGVRPDGAWGRVTLAPDLIEAFGAPETNPIRHLAVDGIRVGDARIAFDYRITPTGGTFRIVQTGGRVPVNVVFEPILPFRVVSGARFEDEPIEVGVEPGPQGGTRLRLQFPLDPERSIHVDGHD